MTICEITSKSALVKSGLPGFEYALNPYLGCSHACIYCYAPSILRYKGNEEEAWGDFVGVKRNLPRVLSKELRGGKIDGVIGIGTVTDPYQPAEKSYEVTRNCLNVLLEKDLKINIMTKSSLVLRDLDLLNKFSKCEVGFSMSSIDDRVREMYEPGSMPFDEKLKAIRVLRENGIMTWVFLAPIMPYITDKDEDLEMLISEISPYVDLIMVDRLRLKGTIWEDIRSFLQEYDPRLIEVYYDILYHKTDYFKDAGTKIVDLCRKNNIKYDILF